MGNLAIYEAVRKVPTEAQKKISGGRLNGKTDINPVWRIKALTELFGACGVGWKYEIVRLWLEAGAKDETAAFAEIKLYIKANGEWSDGIPGIGGSMFVANEKSGLYTSDECFKMATTDALSVACKALGVGADIYWEADASKYDKRAEQEQPKAPPKQEHPKSDTKINLAQSTAIFNAAKAIWGDEAQAKLIDTFKIDSLKSVTVAQYEPMMAKLERLKNGTANG